jgi:hypothetical protein
MKIACLALLLATGCSSAQTESGWVLTSYNSGQGYAFRKDGVTYLAHCHVAKITNAQAIPGAPRATTRTPAPPGFVPESSDESDCSEILPFINHTVPQLAQEPTKDQLHFKAPSGNEYWFQITEAN